MPLWSRVIYRLFVIFLQDEVEANGGGLWVLEEVLWESDRREQAVAEGGSGAESTETFPTVLHANDPTHNTHHVSLVWACRGPTQLLILNRRAPAPPPNGFGPDPAHPHQPVGIRHPNPPPAAAVRRLPHPNVNHRMEQGHFGHFAREKKNSEILYIKEKRKTPLYIFRKWGCFVYL